jgi:hypothetical protein
VNAAYRSIGKKVEALTAEEFNQTNELEPQTQRTGV